MNNQKYDFKDANIALVDADLLNNNTRHPNLALMKLSGWYKSQNCRVRLVEDWDELKTNNYLDTKVYDQIHVFKVFDFSKYDENILKLDNVSWGGTGFFWKNDYKLPEHIEHFMPDYHIYDEYITNHPMKRKTYWKDYQEFSIGFTTRGCFRKCPFCVNEKYDKVIFHSHVNEWLDKSRPGIYLLDDNILAYSKWEEVFDELNNTGKKFNFKQGMDIRLMTNHKAEVVSKSNYYSVFIFAFDHIKDKELIENKLQLWREHTNKLTRLYVLVAYEGLDRDEIINAFERIKILSRYDCLPYIMRHENYLKSPYRGFFITLAMWVNQPFLFRKKTIREFALAQNKYTKSGISASFRYLKKVEEDFPDIAERYFDVRFGDWADKNRNGLE